MKPKPVEQWLRRIAKALIVICLLIFLVVIGYSAATGSTYSGNILLMLLFCIGCLAAVVWLATELSRSARERRKATASPAATATKEAEPDVQPTPAPADEPQPDAPAPKLPMEQIVQCPWGTCPPLSEAVETGPVGAGDRHQYMSQGEICIIHDATDRVRYYYFADGTLVLTGTGATKSVDPGGHDGRNGYLPENPPWSETVCQNTVRVLVTEGITALGSGLLDSLIKLEELNLADSVESVGFNSRRQLHILRAGKQFRSFSGFTAPLTGLVLPDHTVHFQYHNSGSLPGVTSKDPAIQAKLDDHLQREYAETMAQLFRLYPGIAEKMAPIARYHKETAASALVSLDWNSKYRRSRLVGTNDLYELHGLPKKAQHTPVTKIKLEYQYGLHNFVMIAAMLHAVILTTPRELHCSIDHIRWNDELSRWWQAVNPQVKLVITRKSGEAITVEAANQVKPKPAIPKQAHLPQYRNSYAPDLVAAARQNFSESKLKEFDEQYYQFTMDINRGGFSREQAAANRGFVLLGTQAAPEPLAIRMHELYEKSPYRRANRPFEIAGPNRDSLCEAEIRYFLPLADAHLADKLDWGQSEYYAVDTRTWEPWYIVEQYDGAAVAHTWFEVKETITWEEVQLYAPQAAKSILGHDRQSPWRFCTYWHTASSDGSTMRWRGTRQTWFEAKLHKTESGAVLQLTTHAHKAEPKVTQKPLTQMDCDTLEAFTQSLHGLGISKTFIIESLWDGLRQAPKATTVKHPRELRRKTLDEEIRGARRQRIYGHDSGHGWQVSVGLVPNSRTAFVEVTEDGYPNPGASGGFFRTLPHRLVKDGCVKVGDVLAFVAENTPCNVSVDNPDQVIRL